MVLTFEYVDKIFESVHPNKSRAVLLVTRRCLQRWPNWFYLLKATEHYCLVYYAVQGGSNV